MNLCAAFTSVLRVCIVHGGPSHGIFSNQVFDPQHRYDGAWYWDTPQIHATILWQAAYAAGITTASIDWPLTVDASDIDYTLPEFWRGSPGEQVTLTIAC